MATHSQIFSNPSVLLEDGAYLSARIELHPTDAAKRGERPEPAFIKALVDTGARFTVVDELILVDFGLVPTDFLTLHTAAGTAEFPVYACSIGFVGTGLPSFVGRVLGGSMHGAANAVLLGRDFLAKHILGYDGVYGYFSLSA